jgi:8-amino-7-oxononanoate synthase
VHEEVEKELADLVGYDAALIFGNGFLANLGVLCALAGRGDAIFEDRLNHASLIDGARLSGARLRRYRHGDANHLEDLLRKRPAAGRSIIVSDSLFSMDGDIAPVADLASVAGRYGALLVVDEAHAIGIFGKSGGGICRSADGPTRPDVVVGTMSKALGGYGGFAAGTGALRDILVNRARSFIYSTGLPPACAASASAAARIVRGDPSLGKELLARALRFRELLAANGFDVTPSQSQIIPLRVGESERTVALAQAVLRRGILAVPVRPPTVPPGTARLRLSVTLAHGDGDLERAAGLLRNAAVEVGLF